MLWSGRDRILTTQQPKCYQPSELKLELNHVPVRAFQHNVFRSHVGLYQLLLKLSETITFVTLVSLISL